MSEAERLLGLLADPDRFRVAAALALGSTDVGDVVAVTGLPPRVVERSLARLIAGGLVTKDAAGHRFQTEELLVAARAVADKRAATDAAENPEGATEMVTRFMKQGRLVSIPSKGAKRAAVLDHVAQDFEPGRRYSEKQVNAVLAAYHDDVASLRRYLVDDGYLDRARGKYWRTGGTWNID
ncbi:MAG TPA: DUF2087 domain-containing protein [Actinomycetota bacterium]|nr:DUF2087 domain-containing protein [Actinomycetota bacterium]